MLVRGAVAVLGYNDLAADPDSYSRLAITWAKSGTFGFEGEQGVTPTAFRPPLYPWLLSWCVDGASVSRVGVAMLHVLLGCATVGLTYLIGVSLASSRRVDRGRWSSRGSNLVKAKPTRDDGKRSQHFWQCLRGGCG